MVQGRSEQPPQTVGRTAIAFVVAALLLLVAAPPVQAAAAQLQVTAAPSPSDPVAGTPGSITLSLTNAGDATAFRIQLIVQRVDPAIQINNTGYVSVGALGVGDSTTITPYVYWIPSETPPGVYLAEFRIEYAYDSGTATEYGGFTVATTITVRSAPALRLGPLVPDELMAGSTAVLNLTLRNAGFTPLTRIEGAWLDAEKILVPRGEGNLIFVSRLEAGQSVKVPIRVAATASASELRQLTFTFTYSDGSGRQTTTASTFAIHVQSNPMLRVALDEWLEDSITLSISNVGTGIAQSVEVRILPDGPVRSRPAAAIFLGNLDPGDHTTATFSPASVVRSLLDAPLQAQVAFTDADGVRRTETQSLDLGEPPSDGAMDWLPIWTVSAVVLVAALAGGGYYLRRRRQGPD